jgi:glycosyltransferase 2 family protein
MEVNRDRVLRWVKPALKWSLGAVVLVFAGRHVARTWYELHAEGRLIRLDPAWLGLSIALYLAGLCLCGVFYRDLLSASPTPTRLGPAVRAYLISHLGKYVPGKAMVVVMRVGLTVPYGARPATAAFATVYETLVMMASGALIAVLGFLLSPMLTLPIAAGRLGTWHPPIIAVAVALEMVFLIVVAPPIFRRLSGLIHLPFPSIGPSALPELSGRLLARGFAWTGAGWILLGLSQAAILQSLLPGGLAPSLWPAVVASVALATVAGFVVGIAPGGLGVREWVLWTVLGAAIDRDMAVVAALALRLAWVAAEVLAALALSAIRPPLPPVAP